MDVTRYAPDGMVCSVDHLASGAGAAMLRAGGTAADAAVATSAVLAVTTQHMCGMGGDLLALVSTGDGPPVALNASGRAGAGADPARLRADGHRTMPLRGDIRSVPVPGCVDGWLALHERFGRLPLAEVLAPARHYASDGFAAAPTLARSVPAIAHLDGADDYRAAGAVRPGTRIRRPGVAAALEAIVAHGRSGFYEGAFGEGLLALGAGEYDQEDLRRPIADWVPALGIDAWGHRLWTMPPNSQGYLTLAAAGILDGIELPAPDEPAWAHLLVEAMRQAAYDRLDVLHEGADGESLISAERLAPRRAALSTERAATLGEPPIRPGGTIYLCAVDGDRMGVSLIQSNASGWGAHIVEPTTRIFLQDRGIGFSLEPGHPAEYGPGRRPPHTLSPALVTHADDRLAMVLGTMGGDSQPQVVLQLLARILVAGQTPGAAVAAPRWVLGDADEGAGFDTWRARGRVRVELERGVPDQWPAALEALGHRVAPAGNVGHAHVIAVGDDHVAGAADPRALAEAASGL